MHPDWLPQPSADDWPAHLPQTPLNIDGGDQLLHREALRLPLQSWPRLTIAYHAPGLWPSVLIVPYFTLDNTLWCLIRPTTSGSTLDLQVEVAGKLVRSCLTFWKAGPSLEPIMI